MSFRWVSWRKLNLTNDLKGYSNEMTAQRRLLVVLAHPDDESFGMAGTIAKYVSEGVEVSLICTTNGDVGTVDAEFLRGFNSVSELRLAELKCASEVLHLTNVYTFGYRDSGMAGSEDNKHPHSLVTADQDEVTERIVKVIRALRPQVIVTFDPFGGYGHPDHIATHHAVVKAFEAAHEPTMFPEHLKSGLGAFRPDKLYFTTFDRRIFKFMIALMARIKILGDPTKMGRNKDIDGVEIASHTYPIHATINTRSHSAIADKARQCHASQLGGIGPRSMSQIITRFVFGVRDTYMRFYPPATTSIRETDLFEQVKSQGLKAQ